MGNDELKYFKNFKFFFLFKEKIGPQFLDGVTKLTYVPGYNGDYIRFDEIIQKVFIR